MTKSILNTNILGRFEIKFATGKLRECITWSRFSEFPKYMIRNSSSKSQDPNPLENESAELKRLNHFRGPKTQEDGEINRERNIMT